MALKSKEEDFNRDALFKKLFDRFHRGDVLITVATGEMTEIEEERTGLVSAHVILNINVNIYKRNSV